MMRITRLLMPMALALSLSPAAIAQQNLAIRAPQAPRSALLMDGKQTLTQKVLVRPGATLHTLPEAADGRPIPGFTLYHVYARRDGWIEVGPDAQGAPIGWMREERSVAWRQTMVLSFTNPVGRDRTMFFAERDPLRRVILAQDMTAAAAAARIANDGRVIALEPETFVDITRNFYLLPVLSAEEIENERGHRMRLLEVASAPAEPTRASRANPGENFRGTIVFLLDTTLSMQPYLDRTRNAIRNVMDRVGETALRDRFRFGLIAYRDAMEGNANLEYVTRVFARPDFAAPVTAILPRIAAANAATESNEGFDEDAIAGLKAAIDEIDWDSYGGRFLILVTDAGAREANDPRSSTRLGIREIRDLLTQRQIAPFVLHLQTPEGRNNHARARAQYTALTRFEGTNGSLYYPIPNGEVAAFGQTVEAITEALLQQVATLTGTPVGQLRAQPTAAAPNVVQQVEVVAQAMRLSYLGRTQETQAPDILRSFSTPIAPTWMCESCCRGTNSPISRRRCAWSWTRPMQAASRRRPCSPTSGRRRLPPREIRAGSAISNGWAAHSASIWTACRIGAR